MHLWFYPERLAVKITLRRSKHDALPVCRTRCTWTKNTMSQHFNKTGTGKMSTKCWVLWLSFLLNSWEINIITLSFMHRKIAVLSSSMTNFAVVGVDFKIELTNVHKAQLLPWVKAGMTMFVAWSGDRLERSNWPALLPQDEHSWNMCRRLRPDKDLGKIHKCTQ